MKLIRKSMLAVVCLLSGAMMLGAAWTTRRLTNTEDSLEPDIAVWGSHVFAVWADNKPGNLDIYFKKSMNGGATWQAIKRLSNTAGFSLKPKIAVSGLNVYVIWGDDTPGNWDIYFIKSTDNGATWGTARKLTNNTHDSEYPDIAVSGSNVYVVWQDNNTGICEIYFSKSTDNGATWETARKLTNNAGFSGYPALAVSGANVYLVWHDNTPGNLEIYFRKSTDGGATWQTQRKLTNTVDESEHPDIVIGGLNVYVVWHNDTPGNYEIYFRKSTDGGATWQNAKKLTDNTGTSWEPRIAVNSSNVYMVWHDDTTGINEVYFRKSTYAGATWQIESMLTNSTGGCRYPAIAVSGAKVYVVWMDDTPGTGGIFLKYSPL